MCRPCKNTPRYTTEDQSRNGVRVLVRRFVDEHGVLTGTTVEADCGCFGSPGRAHTNSGCPRLRS